MPPVVGQITGTKPTRLYFRLPSRQASPWHLYRLFCAPCLSRCHHLRFPSGSCHVASLCRSASSAATAAFTCFHWDQKHFHIFLPTFWEDLWPFTVLSQPHHLRCVQNKVVPTQFLLHLLDTQLPSDSASVSIMRSSACLSELLPLPRSRRLSPLPALAQVPEATAAPQPVRLFLVLQVAS